MSSPAPAKRVRRSHAERREEAERRLLDAALAIVAQRGSVRMTLAEVGEAAGYSRGLAAHRFGSKAGLVQALAGYIGEQFGQQRARGPALQPGLEAIVGNIRFYFSRRGGAWTSSRALLVMMNEACIEAQPELRPVVVAYNRSALAWFEQHIATGIARGEISRRQRPGHHRGAAAGRHAGGDAAVAGRPQAAGERRARPAAGGGGAGAAAGVIAGSLTTGWPDGPEP